MEYEAGRGENYWNCSGNWFQTLYLYHSIRGWVFNNEKGVPMDAESTPLRPLLQIGWIAWQQSGLP